MMRQIIQCKEIHTLKVLEKYVGGKGGGRLVLGEEIVKIKEGMGVPVVEV